MTDQPYAQVVYGYSLPIGWRLGAGAGAGRQLRAAGVAVAEGGYHASGARTYVAGVEVCEAWAE